MNRMVKWASIIAIMVGYFFGMAVAGFNVANAQGDGISQPFFGKYNLDGLEVTSDCLYLRAATTSSFEGYYQGYGTVACSNMGTDYLLFNPDSGLIGGENFVFRYHTWSRLVGDSFVPQSGSIDVMGYIRTDTSDGNKKKARICHKEYIRM
ncbi:MAG: hypothetical protein ACI4JS_00340 [Oscillospiraceae bacterium]